MFNITKRNKRVVVINDLTDEIIYCPPNFITLNSRDDLQELVDTFNREDRRDIQAIMEFESKLHPLKMFRQ